MLQPVPPGFRAAGAPTRGFQAAFDRLHREMRLLLRDERAPFDECAARLAQRRLLRGDESCFLDMCRGIRNFLAHSSDAVAERLLRVEVEPAVAERLGAIAARIANRVPAAHFVIPWRQVRCGRLDEPLEALMAEMVASDFSHVPVLRDGCVAAVFDERTLFRALAGDRLDAVTPGTRLGDVIDATLSVQRAPEAAGVLFLPRRASLAELRAGLAAAQERGRVSLVIVTEAGDPCQKPLGLLTIWDVPDEP